MTDENQTSPEDKRNSIRFVATLVLYVVAVICVLLAFFVANKPGFNSNKNAMVLVVIVELILGDRILRIIDYLNRSSSRKTLICGTVYWLLCLLVVSFAAM